MREAYFSVGVFVKLRAVYKGPKGGFEFLLFLPNTEDDAMKLSVGVEIIFEIICISFFVNTANRTFIYCWKVFESNVIPFLLPFVQFHLIAHRIKQAFKIVFFHISYPLEHCKIYVL